jgi:hypothetical protein
MANLLGQNIGTNYKGILNLNTLNGNLTTTLEAITDGDGNASTLLLSTTLARVSSNLTIGGSTTASARLHVRGDGTNPIALFENGAGTSQFNIQQSGQINFANQLQGPLLRASTNLACSSFTNQSYNGTAWLVVNDTLSTLSFTTTTINLSAGSTSPRMYSYAYTINNSGAQTGTATGIFLNATETALNGMGHNLMDLQVGGASRFRVDRNGNVITPEAVNCVGIFFGNNGLLRGNSPGVFSFNTFDRLQLGGTTNAFPAIKRNGANIDFRFADDSTFCNIRAGRLDLTGALLTGFINDATNAVTAITIANTSGNLLFNTPSLFAASGTINASARLQVDSTTQGFLPPRMTTTQKNAITTPATGLVLYDTTLNKLCVYTGSAWETITSV